MPAPILKPAYQNPKPFVLHDGRRYPLSINHGLWRMRSQARGRKIDVTLGTADLAAAKRYAKDWLESPAGQAAHKPKGKGTLEELAQAYLTMPKRVGVRAAASNVSRLRGVVRLVMGQELEAVPCKAITPALWSTYFSKVLETDHGRALDYTLRRTENARLNAAVRAARSIFLPKLATEYAARGLAVASNASDCMMLPEPWIAVAAADDPALIAAWERIQESNPRLWLVIGLARFAGLRREEITHARGKWILSKDGATHIVLRDRPEDLFQTKTGKPYRALVLSPALAVHLANCRPDSLIVPETSPRWFRTEVSGWLRPFVGDASKPLHRLRGLYADQLARDTESAVLARQAALRAAQEGLGHTSARTTEKHYLDADALR